MGNNLMSLIQLFLISGIQCSDHVPSAVERQPAGFQRHGWTHQVPHHDRLQEGLDARHIFQERETRQVPQNHSAQPLHQGLSQRRHPLQHKVRLVDVPLKSVLFAQTVQMAWELKLDFLETFFSVRV